MERAERQELFGRIESGADGGRDYLVMMVLSATLASLGLLQGSTAVVIGAMLVAPLMGPLVGAGLALVQGNLELMRRSMTVAAIGIALGFAVAMFFGAINPGYEPTMEVEARGTPDIFDLFIALTSGMIAAYAQCQQRLSDTLAGVAIAAALLPPLAVVGIATTLEEHEIAIFAAILLMTNVVAIIIGAALIFRLFGVEAQGGDSGARPWVRRFVGALLTATLLLSTPLVLRSLEQNRAGQTRPASYPVSVPVRHAIQTFLTHHPQIQLISVARLSVEPESGITLVLSTFEPVPRGFRRGLRNAVRETLGEPLLDDLTDEPGERVRIYIVLEAPYVPEATPDDAESPADVIELEIAEPPVDRRLDDEGSESR
jgi:uncharacterized hydrophobic protein (TIGR00271 family)